MPMNRGRIQRFTFTPVIDPLSSANSEPLLNSSGTNLEANKNSTLRKKYCDIHRNYVKYEVIGTKVPLELLLFRLI